MEEEPIMICLDEYTEDVHLIQDLLLEEAFFEGAEEKLNQMPNVYRLTVSHESWYFSMRDKFPLLKELLIHSVDFISVDFLESFRNHPKIETLWILNELRGDLSKVPEIIRSMPSLRFLWVNFIKDGTFFQKLLPLPKLEILNLNYSDATDQQMSGLAGCISLKKLNIDHFPKLSGQTLGSYLHGMKLEHITCAEQDFGPELITHIASLTGLRKIYFRYSCGKNWADETIRFQWNAIEILDFLTCWLPVQLTSQILKMQTCKELALKGKFNPDDCADLLRRPALDSVYLLSSEPVVLNLLPADETTLLTSLILENFILTADSITAIGQMKSLHALRLFNCQFEGPLDELAANRSIRILMLPRKCETNHYNKIFRTKERYFDWYGSD